MGFRINTNIAAMNAHRNSTQTNLALDKSLQALSSGLRINTAADDASGLSIANQLRSQSTGLGQAIANANDGVGVMQTADGALDEYENILNTVRTKAIQAASDGQNTDSRQAIQNDITKLLEEADTIAQTTQFNGQALLDGTFQNKAFHIGAYKDETVDVSISSARTSTIGQHVNTAGTKDFGGGAGVVNTAAALSAAALAFDSAFAINGITTGVSAAETGATGGMAEAHSAGSAWAKANAINAIENKTGVHASAETVVTGAAIGAGDSIASGDLKINGVDIGAVTFGTADSDSSLMNAINAVSNQTNVIASHDGNKIVLTANDGSEIHVATTNGSAAKTGLGATDADQYNSGVLTLSSGSAVTVTEGASGTAAFEALAASKTLSVKDPANTADVTTRAKAEDTILTMDFALKQVDAIRSNIGSTQNQLESTVRNISVTQVNVAAAESQIRDVDFAAESANFSKQNILAQSGTYAMSQANAVQQNVMRLLQ
jgi:flagellin